MSKKRVQETCETAIRDAHPELVGLSHRIHGYEELAFDEVRSAADCVNVLRSFGIDAEAGAYGLETGFVAEFGEGERGVVLCCEYDALPDIGHACAHNVIAAAGVGAAIGLFSVMDTLPLRVRVLGTPAEESGGGKVQLLDSGAFDGFDAALMVHAFNHDAAEFHSLASQDLVIEYVGRPSHAATAPSEGVNAGDAATLAQVAVGLMRQQLPEGVSVHGFVREAGTASNIIPSKAILDYKVRARDTDLFDVALAKLRSCFEGAAIATGCELHISEPSPPYKAFVPNTLLAASYKTHAMNLGRVNFQPSKPVASTDMGNVSHALPSLHALIDIGSGSTTPHQEDFAAAAVGPLADKAVLDAAIGLAQTAIDVTEM